MYTLTSNVGLVTVNCNATYKLSFIIIIVTLAILKQVGDTINLTVTFTLKY